MLLERDKIDQFINIERIFTKCPGCNLAVHNPGRDICIVGGDLAPTVVTFVGSHPHEGQVFTAEGLDTCDFHPATIGFAATVLPQY